MRAAHLPLDVRLAEDHRLEARGDAVEVAGGVAVARRVDRVGELGRADLGASCQQAENVCLRLNWIPARPADDEVDLRAVAGGDHNRLSHLLRGCRLARELARLALAEREAFAQRHGRGLVGDTQRQQLAHASVDSGC